MERVKVVLRELTDDVVHLRVEGLDDDGEVAYALVQVSRAEYDKIESGSVEGRQNFVDYLRSVWHKRVLAS